MPEICLDQELNLVEQCGVLFVFLITGLLFSTAVNWVSSLLSLLPKSPTCFLPTAVAAVLPSHALPNVKELVCRISHWGLVNFRNLVYLVALCLSDRPNIQSHNFCILAYISSSLA